MAACPYIFPYTGAVFQTGSKWVGPLFHSRDTERRRQKQKKGEGVVYTLEALNLDAEFELCACVRACLHACMRACVRAPVRLCARACVPMSYVAVAYGSWPTPYGLEVQPGEPRHSRSNAALNAQHQELRRQPGCRCASTCVRAYVNLMAYFVLPTCVSVCGVVSASVRAVSQVHCSARSVQCAVRVCVCARACVQFHVCGVRALVVLIICWLVGRAGGQTGRLFWEWITIYL